MNKDALILVGLASMVFIAIVVIDKKVSGKKKAKASEETNANAVKPKTPTKDWKPEDVPGYVPSEPITVLPKERN